MSDATGAAADGARRERLTAERAIEQLLYRYARGVDRGDLVVVRSCYWDEGFDDHMGFAGQADDFCAWLATVLGNVDVLTHQFTNVTVEVSDDGMSATSDAYCNNTCVWQLGGRERHLLSCLSYIDRLERRNGEWRLVHRTCRRVWSRMEEFATWDDAGNA
jgi:hypothetical protein